MGMYVYSNPNVQEIIMLVFLPQASFYFARGPRARETGIRRSS